MTRRTRPTRRLAGVLLLTATVYAAGANVAAGWVIAVAAAVGAVALLSAAGHAVGARRLSARASAPRRGDEGAVPVTVALTLPMRVVGTVTCGGATAPLPTAPGEHRVTVTVPLRRGADQAVSAEVTCSDPLGLIRTRLRVGPVVTTVHPAPTTGHHTARTPIGADDDGVAGRPAGRALPDAELRRWRPGEPVRMVHWPTSLRTGEMQSRTLVDIAHPVMELGIPAGVWQREELDERCRAVRAAAEAAAREGTPVVVVVVVVVVADGRRTPWGSAALDLLASLPPHAGAPPRALAGPPGLS